MLNNNHTYNLSVHTDLTVTTRRKTLKLLRVQSVGMFDDGNSTKDVAAIVGASVKNVSSLRF